MRLRRVGSTGNVSTSCYSSIVQHSTVIVLLWYCCNTVIVLSTITVLLCLLHWGTVLFHPVTAIIRNCTVVCFCTMLTHMVRCTPRSLLLQVQKGWIFQGSISSEISSRPARLWQGTVQLQGTACDAAHVLPSMLSVL